MGNLQFRFVLLLTMTFARAGIGAVYHYRHVKQMGIYRPFTGIPEPKPLKVLSSRKYRNVRPKVDTNMKKRLSKLSVKNSKNKRKRGIVHPMSQTTDSTTDEIKTETSETPNESQLILQPGGNQIFEKENSQGHYETDKSEDVVANVGLTDTSVPTVFDSRNLTEKDLELGELHVDNTAEMSENGLKPKKKKCCKCPKGPKCRIPAPIKSALVETGPALVLIFVSGLFALLFWVIENRGHNIQTGKPCSISFWDSLYYINTIHTTIGYGTVFPCSSGGRGLTLIYLFIGLPAMLICLNKFGKVLLAVVHILDGWIRLVRKRKDISAKPNILLGLLMAILWILLMSATVYYVDSYFTTSTTENFFGAFYFTLITLTTVGLGDVDFKERQLTVAYFAMIFMGYGMVSMVLQLFQEKMEEILNEMIAEAKAAQTAAEMKDSDGQVLSTQSTKFLSMFLTEAQQSKLHEAMKDKCEVADLATQFSVPMANQSTSTGMDVVTPNWKLTKIAGYDGVGDRKSADVKKQKTKKKEEKIVETPEPEVDEIVEETKTQHGDLVDEDIKKWLDDDNKVAEVNKDNDERQINDEDTDIEVDLQHTVHQN